MQLKRMMDERCDAGWRTFRRLLFHHELLLKLADGVSQLPLLLLLLLLSE